MPESFLAEVLRYVRFEARHEQALRRFHPQAEPLFGEVVDEFYQRLQEHEAARAVFKNQAQIDRLKVSLHRWLGSLLEGPWDQRYYEARARIGARHVKVGLPQRYMLTAMSQIRGRLFDIARQTHPVADERVDLEQALDKICDVELAIMLETYRDDSIEAVERVQILERELLQRRFRITEARYQSILETAEVLVIAVDPQGHVVLFNRKAEETLAVSRSEMVDIEILASMFEAADFEAFTAALDRALSGGEPPLLTTRIYNRREQERWIAWHVTTPAATGDPFVCAIGVDQTEERVLAEKTLRSERLASLGTLAAGLAHEIRNPLNAAQLQLLLVERRLAKIEAPPGGTANAPLQAAQVVKLELARLASLVEDFLAFARPSRLRLSAGDLAVTLRQVAELLGPDLAANGSELTLDLPETLAAHFDDERLRQVLLNLLRNATEATGQGGHIEVQLLRERNRAVIEVRDDGPGLPADLQIFEPFQTSKEGGTGLGLSIAHRIVGDHGGSLTAERRDAWTVFRLELPIDGPDAD